MVSEPLHPNTSATESVEDSSRGPSIDPTRHRLRLPTHRLAPDPNDTESARTWVANVDGPTAIDLFCGAGGLSLGLQQAGFTVLVGADVDPLSVETHVANLGGLGYAGDLTDPTDLVRNLKRWGIKTVDLVAGGVPCQPFSRAGRSKIRSLVASGARPAHDPRADLWESFMTVVRELRPRAVLLENVPDLAVWNEGSILVGLCESLRELGYRTDTRVLAAVDYGVPQHRTRLILVAARPGTIISWPAARTSERPTIHAAIGDLPPVPAGHFERDTAYGGPQSTLQRELRRGVPTRVRSKVFDHVTRPVRSDDAEAFAYLREGETYAQLPARLQRYRVDIFADKYKRLEWNGLSRSITAHLAKDGYWYIHPEQHRTLSVREAARIQTFPDWFRFAGAITAQYRQIGNAVPPMLARAVGVELRNALAHAPRRGRPRGTGKSFRSRLTEWHKDNAREYPWRTASNPWHVLIAEICLRRTRAEQVAPVYQRLIELAPTPADMVARQAEAGEAMRSLGLHWRARNLIAIADEINRRFGGAVPESEVDLLSLPGVGHYVAQAVRCFGFGKPATIVDTNTQRIITRLLGRTNPSRWQMRLDLYRLGGPRGADASFNYALLDFGALVCQARSPRCGECPARQICATYAESKGKAGRKAA